MISDLAPTHKNTDTEAHPELSKSVTGSVDSDSEVKKTTIVKLPPVKKPVTKEPDVGAKDEVS